MKVCLNLCLVQTVHITILRMIYIEALIIRIRDNFYKSSNSLDIYYYLLYSLLCERNKLCSKMKSISYKVVKQKQLIPQYVIIKLKKKLTQINHLLFKRQ